MLFLSPGQKSMSNIFTPFSKLSKRSINIELSTISGVCGAVGVGAGCREYPIPGSRFEFPA